MSCKIGDYVRLTEIFDQNIADHRLSVGNIIEVIGDREEDGWVFTPNGVEVSYVNYYPREFEKVSESAKEALPMSDVLRIGDLTPPEVLGVFRPALEDRKVGKVPMHMVFDGFPHALEHVAEIMAWAEEKKGYKLHDWKNLPGAELELPAANYRHSSVNSKQKAIGLSAIERVDHESGKLHIGHQIFNLIAELQLILEKEAKQKG